MLRIPLLHGGRANHASSADSSSSRRMPFYRHSQRERFESPLPGQARVAVLAPNFAERNGVRCFVEEELPAIELFHPEILAGTVHALLRLAASLRIPRAVVAFSGARIGPLTSRDRDLLWTGFQVPIFEQWLLPDGSVMARECQAHDGLHLVSPAHYRGELLSDPCPCGQVEPRIFTPR
jgi:hypothetical protein